MGETFLNQILRGTFISGGAWLVTAIVGVARGKAIAVLLGPVGIGLYGTYLSLVAMASTLAGLGLGTSGAREVASAADDRGAAIARRAVATGSVALGALGLGVVLALRRWISEALFGTDAYADDVSILGLALFLSLLANGFLAILQGSRRVGQMAIANVTGTVSGVALGVALIAMFGLPGVAWLVLLVPAATALAAYRLSSTIQTAMTGISWHEVWLRWRNMLQIGFAVMCAALIGHLSQLIVRALITRGIGDGLVAAGLFHAAWTLSMGYLGFILNAMTVEYFPRLTALANDRDLLVQAVNEQVEAATLFSAPALLVTIAFSGPLLAVFFDSTFAAAADLLRLQIVGDVLKVASWPVAFIILAKGDARLYVVTETIAHATYLSVTAILLPVLDLRAAGIAFIAMYLVYFVMICYVARRKYMFVWARGVLFKLLACLAAVTATLLATRFDDTAARALGSLAAIAFLLYAVRWMRARQRLPSSATPFRHRKA